MIDVSIIIATRNRKKILEESLSYAVEAIKNYNAEIIVVNDGDYFNGFTDPNLSRKGIILLDNHENGLSCARNKGALHSKGEILFFIDDDIWINSDVMNWIHINLNKQLNIDAIYNINWIYPPDLTQRLKNTKIGRYLLSSSYNTMWGRMNVNQIEPSSGLFPYHSVASCSLIMSKFLFNRIGGYNSEVSFQGEDIDLSNRIKGLAIPLYCVFDVTIYHNHMDRLDFDGFIKRIRQGYQSQFEAEVKGIIPISYSISGLNNFFFTLLVNTEKLWLFIFRIIPNNKFFTPLSSKVLGSLLGLEKYKQWRRAVKRKGK